MCINTFNYDKICIDISVLDTPHAETVVKLIKE